MAQFTRSHDADINWTSRLGFVSVPPATLVDRFGKPDDFGSGDGKVSMRYVFVSPEGDVATLYDYKAGIHGTTLRHRKTPFEFHVGGHEPAAAKAFIAWLETELGLE